MSTPQNLQLGGFVSHPVLKGTTVYVRSALPIIDAGATTVNILTSKNELLLHVGFRPHESRVVLNTWRNGDWEHEEYIPNPRELFVSGAQASFAIADAGGVYQISFNRGRDTYTFKKRFNDEGVGIEYKADGLSMFSNRITVTFTEV